MLQLSHILLISTVAKICLLYYSIVRELPMTTQLQVDDVYSVIRYKVRWRIFNEFLRILSNFIMGDDVWNDYDLQNCQRQICTALRLAA